MGSSIRISTKAVKFGQDSWEALRRKRTLVSVPGAEPDADLLRAHGCHDSIDNFQAKTRAILDTTAVVVRTLVRHVLLFNG